MYTRFLLYINTCVHVYKYIYIHVCILVDYIFLAAALIAHSLCCNVFTLNIGMYVCVMYVSEENRIDSMSTNGRMNSQSDSAAVWWPPVHASVCLSTICSPVRWQKSLTTHKHKLNTCICVRIHTWTMGVTCYTSDEELLFSRWQALTFATKWADLLIQNFSYVEIWVRAL